MDLDPKLPFFPAVLPANLLLPFPARSCHRTVVPFVEHSVIIMDLTSYSKSLCLDYCTVPVASVCETETCALLWMVLMSQSVSGPVPVCLQGKFNKMQLLCDMVIMHSRLWILHGTGIFSLENTNCKI